MTPERKCDRNACGEATTYAVATLATARPRITVLFFRQVSDFAFDVTAN